MAVEELEYPGCRKRKRGYGRRKFVVKDRVEVRSMEDGFLGSWHPGTVVQCRKQKVYVEYDHVLDDTGSDYLIQTVNVPAILDGASSTTYNERGFIRPIPPLKEFGKWDLPFGLCVDAYCLEAWWEGVIFDQCDGKEKRAVFFPDLGDEMNIRIEHLRITHDWNEVTEEWTRRGMWVFLELVEECERDNYVTVSVKQIWYDVRAKKDFNKIKDWTYNVKELWRGLVLEVINEYYALTMREVLSVWDFSKDLLTEPPPEPESDGLTVDIHVNPERNSDNFHSVSNSYNQLTSRSNVLYDDAGPSNALVHDISLAENHLEKGDGSNFLNADRNSGSIILIQETLGDGVSKMAEKEGPEQKEPTSPEEEFLPDIPEGISGQDAGTAGKVNYGDGCYKRIRHGELSTQRRLSDWTPLILSEVELCPDSVRQYGLTSNRKIREQLKTNVRKHIAYLGWKIEWTPYKDDFQYRRYRYTSPETEGRPFVSSSLVEVCKHIEKDTNTDSLLSQEDQRRKYPIIDSNMSHPAILPPPSFEDVVEPELGPEAVLRYYMLPLKRGVSADKRFIIPKARKHLLAEGWKYRYHTIKGRGMIYISPQNQHFVSLREACKECIKECLPRWISSGMIPLDISSINKENTGPVDSDNFLCCVSQLLKNEPELYYANGAPASRSIVQCKPEPLRKLKSLDSQTRMHATIDSNISIPATFPPSVEDVIKSEFCPKAVLRYYLYSPEKNIKDVKKCMILQARKHLLAEGWKFEHSTIRKRGMIYMSPQNVRYGSLRVACEACIRKRLPEWISSGTISVDGLGIIEGKMSQLDSDKLSCYVSQLLQKDPELSELNVVPESISTGHCKLKSSRNIKSRPPKGQRKRLPMRLQRSSKRVQTVCAPCPSRHKSQNVLSWLIDCNVLLPRSKVHYRARGTGHSMAEGRITRDGIKCSCCQKLYSLGGFECHATGLRNCRSAAANIVLENGKSLMDFQMQIMNEHKKRGSTQTPSKSVYQEENDGICSICQYGGELLLCDNCPSSFHQSCLGFQDIPQGDWFCPSCCCGICRRSKTEGADDEKLLTCSQCEHKYHAKCLGKSSVAMSRRYLKNCFCGKNCEKIYAGLHKLLGEPIALGVNNLNWTLLKCVDSENCGIANGRNDLEVESFSKLNVALSVMHECFEPLKESYSGRDLMEDVIFSRWSTLNRLNFQGFYIVILERNEEVITVATVRVYGEKVAEVPLVGTRFQYRRMGMCRILMDELEKRLMQLGVERIVLPAVPSVLDTWINCFGFSKMTNSERSQFLDSTFLDFQDTVMCQKLLIKTPPALVLSTERHRKAHDEVLSESGGSGFDQSSPVSEVYQAEVIDRNDTLDLQMVDAVAGSNEDHLGNDAPSPVALAKEVANSEGEQTQNRSIPECSLEDGSLRHGSTSNATCKYYKRRKISMKR